AGAIDGVPFDCVVVPRATDAAAVDLNRRPGLLKGIVDLVPLDDIAAAAQVQGRFILQPKAGAKEGVGLDRGEIRVSIRGVALDRNPIDAVANDVAHDSSPVATSTKDSRRIRV